MNTEEKNSINYYLYIFIAVAAVVGLGAFAYYGSSSAVIDSQEANRAAGVIITKEDIIYFENVKGYIAYPTEMEVRPAIILIHEWWGLNDDIKELADKFASEGYVALAVDLYGGKLAANPDEARQLSGQVRNNTEPAFDNLKAAVDYLKKRSDVNPEKIASVGWCFGGGWSYQMAANNLGTRASVMYYGQFDPENDFEHMKASIIGHFGENDAGIPVDNVREFRARLATANGEHEIYIYPNAGHGFANFRGGENTAYNKEAADLAWSRTMSFLENTLNNK